MKKSLFLLAFLMLSTGLMAQKHWTFGLNGGIPIGDIEETYNFHASADIAYRIDIIELLDIGAVAGYSHYFGESITDGDFDVDIEDLQFIPVGATGRIRILSLLFVGTDLGYAFSLNDGLDGGFYLRPQIGLNLGIVNILASYENISAEGANLSSINGGVEIKF